MIPVSSWGRLSAQPHFPVALNDPADIAGTLSADKSLGVAMGLGRSYGDVCLNPNGKLWLTEGLSHLIAFDESSGRLVCEAGVTLRDIQRVFVPRGWMLPVTPGTQFVSVGGAIANDVHGKNHHRQGSFGDQVHNLTLVRTDGEVIVCGPGQHSDWFAATVGGMGLTGVIAQAELQLRRIDGPWLETETLPFEGLETFFELSEKSEDEWEHTVSWIDCLSGTRSRGIFLRANPSSRQQTLPGAGRNLSMPVVPPLSLVNRLTLKPFNTAYYRLNKRRAGRALAHYESFFYPLDNLQHWNRMYGPKGFYQYQSVVPPAVGADATAEMLRAITLSGEGSFLAVLKTFGAREAVGMMSFPQPGVTLALDFPNCGWRTLKLFERLDAIVLEAGGRIYPAKDARMPRVLFEAGYPNLDKFIGYRDPGISSAFSRRLIGR